MDLLCFAGRAPAKKTGTGSCSNKMLPDPLPLPSAVTKYKRLKLTC